MKTTLMEEDVVLHNPLSNGTALNDVTLNAAITAIGSAETVLLITSGIWTLALDVIVPDNITLLVPRGSSISVNATKTLTITRPNSVTAGNYTIFTGAGDVALVGNRLVGWWGALGNGVNDDTSEIQKALDTLETDGDSLEFSATGVTKYYRILSTLTLPATNRITVFGAGIGATQIRQETSGQDGIASNAVATNGVTLRDFWLDGAALTARYGLVWGTASAGVNRSFIRNVRISTFATAGIGTRSSILVSVLNCNINSNKEGIASIAGGVSAPNGWSVIGSYFETQTEVAIHLNTAFGWLIAGNIIEANLLGGLRLDSGIGFNISGNYFEGNTTTSGAGAYYDIYLGDSGQTTGMSITGNNFSGVAVTTEDYFPLRVNLISGIHMTGNSVGVNSRFLDCDNTSQWIDVHIGEIGFLNGSLDITTGSDATFQNLPASLMDAELCQNSITQLTHLDGSPRQDRVRHGQMTVDVDAYTITNVSTGTTVEDGNGMLVASGTTASSSSVAYLSAPAVNRGVARTSVDHDKEHVWTFVMSPVGATTNGEMWLVVTTGTTAADPAGDAFGFRVDNLALQGIRHNGSTLTVLDLSTTLVDLTVVTLEVVSAAGRIRWKVNGLQVGTATTLLPAGSSVGNVLFATANNADAVENGFSIQDIRYRVTQTS